MTYFPSEFLVAVLLWLLRAIVSSFICLFIAYISIRSLDRMTTKISEFETIKGEPVATGLFVGGFLILSGLVVFGSMINPFFLGQSVSFGAFFNVQRFLLVLLSFLVSLILGWLFYYVFAQLTPFGVDLDDINNSPLAVGIFLFSYEIFLGLIIFASLMTPLA